MINDKTKLTRHGEQTSLTHNMSGINQSHGLLESFDEAAFANLKNQSQEIIVPARADGYQMTDFSNQQFSASMNPIEPQFNGSQMFHHREMAPMPQGASSADTGINSNNQRNNRSRGTYP